MTSAPAARHDSTLLSIAPSPPTATHGRPSRQRNTGCVRIRAAMLPEAHRPQNGPTPGAHGAASEVSGRWDAQHLSGAYLVAGPEPVGKTQRLHADAIAFGDRRQ